MNQISSNISKNCKLDHFLKSKNFSYLQRYDKKMSDNKDSHFRVCHQGSEGYGERGRLGCF